MMGWGKKITERVAKAVRQRCGVHIDFDPGVVVHVDYEEGLKAIAFEYEDVDGVCKRFVIHPEIMLVVPIVFTVPPDYDSGGQLFGYKKAIGKIDEIVELSFRIGGTG